MSARFATQQSFRASFSAYKENASLRPRRLELARAINKAVQQVAGTQLQVEQKAAELLRLMSACSSQEELSFCLDLLATKLVNQAYAKVRLLPEAAFPLARLAMRVCVAYPVFTELFVATLGSKCIYVAPQYLERKAFPSQAAYMAALGYEPLPADEANPTAPPVFEDELAYFERMGGYVSLYAAFVEGACTPAPGAPPLAGHNHTHAWAWLARLSNMKPRTATAAVMHAFLSQAAFGLHAIYPTQMRKLMEALHKQLCPLLDQTTPPRKAAAIRLEQWLHIATTYLGQYGRFEEPKGRTLPQGQDSDTSQQVITQTDFHANA
jgi:hypothetical protein